jgi:hypothetical protein
MFIAQATEVVDEVVSGAMTFCQMITQTMHSSILAAYFTAVHFHNFFTLRLNFFIIK